MDTLVRTVDVWIGEAPGSPWRWSGKRWAPVLGQSQGRPGSATCLIIAKRRGRLLPGPSLAPGFGPP